MSVYMYECPLICLYNANTPISQYTNTPYITHSYTVVMWTPTHQ